MATDIMRITYFYQNYLRLWLYYMLAILVYCKNIQNLENLDVF